MEFGICSIFPDTSGVVFDTRSKMVMSQGGTAERMKEKVRRTPTGGGVGVGGHLMVTYKT